jgi:hypothetical protein
MRSSGVFRYAIDFFLYHMGLSSLLDFVVFNFLGAV